MLSVTHIMPVLVLLRMLATPSKTEICNARTHEKNTTHAIDYILCVRCVFRVHALRTLRQLENQPLSQFSA